MLNLVFLLSAQLSLLCDVLSTFKSMFLRIFPNVLKNLVDIFTLILKV